MKRTYRYPRTLGTVCCVLEDGMRVELPVFVGLLRHLTVAQHFELLPRPAVARKYTRESLRVAPWQVLRKFPRDWLMANLDLAELSPGRRRGLEYLLECGRYA